MINTFLIYKYKLSAPQSCTHTHTHTHTWYPTSNYFQVPDDSPEERSLLGVVVHALSHEVSKFFIVWGGQLAFLLIKSLFLLRTET